MILKGFQIELSYKLKLYILFQSTLDILNLKSSLLLTYKRIFTHYKEDVFMYDFHIENIGSRIAEARKSLNLT